MIKRRHNFTKRHYRYFVFLLIIYTLPGTVSYVPLTPFSRKLVTSTVRRIFHELNQPERREFAVLSLLEGTVIARSFCYLLWVQLLDFKFR
jgi:hypothetical protein